VVENATVKLQYYSKTEQLELPVDVTVGVGL